MGAGGPIRGHDRALALAALVAMVGGLTVALGDVASLPLGVRIAGGVMFLGGITVFGAITHRAARRTGASFGSALRGSLRHAGKVFVALMP